MTVCILLRWRVLPIVLAAISELFAAGSSCAAEPHWATDFGIGLSSEGRGRDDPHHLSPPLDGSTFSGRLSVERMVNERISLGIEVSGSSEITGRQSERTATTIGTLNGRHRDTLATAVVKYNVWTIGVAGGRPGAHIELDAVAGGGPAWRHTVRQGVVSNINQRGTTAGVDEQFASVVPSATVGLDGVFWVNARTALLTIVRYELLADSDRDAAGFVKTGAGTSAVTFALGARFRF
jgi:hypothetical protein